jgi:hypothetical protein
MCLRCRARVLAGRTAGDAHIAAVFEVMGGNGRSAGVLADAQDGLFGSPSEKDHQLRGLPRLFHRRPPCSLASFSYLDSKTSRSPCQTFLRISSRACAI